MVKACIVRQAAVLEGKCDVGSEERILATLDAVRGDVIVSGSPVFLAGVETVLTEFSDNASEIATAGDLQVMEPNFAELRQEWEDDGRVARELAGLLFEGRAQLETRLMFETIAVDLKIVEAVGTFDEY